MFNPPVSLLDPIRVWSRDDAVHLCARACPGFTSEYVQAALDDGPQKTVDSLLSGEPDADIFPPPDFISNPDVLGQLQKELRATAKKSAERGEVLMKIQRLNRRALGDLQSWWIQRLRYSTWPFREMVVLFWHGHFTSGFQKVREARMMWWQNETFREYGMGSFRELTRLACREPAMAKYLDMANSSAKNPNENLARELMELFALGEGNYSEEDIKELARALTGYQIHRATGRLQFVAGRYDGGEKRFLGNAGRFGLDEAVAVVTDHSACADHVASRLWQFFAGSPPDPELRKQLGSAYRATGMETGPFLRTLLLSRAFYDDSLKGNQIKSPVQWMVGTSIALGTPLSGTDRERQMLKSLGQELFEPPNVKGWEGGKSWISANTLVARNNSVRQLFLSPKCLPDGALERLCPSAGRGDASAMAAALVEKLAPQSPVSPTPIADFISKRGVPASPATVRDAIHLLLTQPAYQLT